jgi:hypothetical protein
MSESPRRLELRLSIPADPAYRDVATDLAVKFAEYLGCGGERRDAVASAAGRAVAEVAAGAGGEARIELSLEGTPTDLTISATNGSHHAETTCPLAE